MRNREGVSNTLSHLPAQVGEAPAALWPILCHRRRLGLCRLLCCFGCSLLHRVLGHELEKPGPLWLRLLLRLAICI